MMDQSTYTDDRSARKDGDKAVPREVQRNDAPVLRLLRTTAPFPTLGDVNEAKRTPREMVEADNSPGTVEKKLNEADVRAAQAVPVRCRCRQRLCWLMPTLV